MCSSARVSRRAKQTKTWEMDDILLEDGGEVMRVDGKKHKSSALIKDRTIEFVFAITLLWPSFRPEPSPQHHFGAPEETGAFREVSLNLFSTAGM